MEIVNVVGYEGLYAITNEGKIYSLKRGIEIQPAISRTGYYQVGLWKNNKHKTERVHHLVYHSFNSCKTFNEDKLVIDHIDGNKLNNNLSNLRKITNRENTSRGMKRRFKVGVVYFKHTGKYGAKIDIERESFYLGCTFPTEDEAAEAYQTARRNWEEKGIKPIQTDKSVKLCKRCGNTKPISEFYYAKGHGISYLCKECAKAYSKQRRLASKQ